MAFNKTIVVITFFFSLSIFHQLNAFEAELTKEQQDTIKCKADRRKKGEIFHNFYLIPKFDNPCANTPTNILNMRKMELSDRDTGLKVLKFPGCYELEAQLFIQNTPETAAWKENKWPNIFTHMAWNLKSDADGDFLEDYDCQNEDVNGCDGAGNNCYYCDFCKSVVRVQLDNNVTRSDIVTCPKGRGMQTLKRSVCFNDWGTLDEDKDGDPDFICEPYFKDYKEIAQEIYNGLGDVQLRLTLANNNTESYKQKRDAGLPGRQALKNMMAEELLACQVLTFDICESEPVLDPYDGTYVCNDLQH